MRRYCRIRSFLLAGLLALGWFIAAPLAAQAAPAPIVFDFEDGLQGWLLSGSATRVQTALLGGDWAIFGDGLAFSGASMFLIGIFDQDDVARVTFDEVVVDDNEVGVTVFWDRLLSLDGTSSPVLSILWDPRGGVEVASFIDNITVHLVPEPGTLALLAVSLGTLVIARRRIG